MAELTCPPLGTGSVDLNALSDAAKKAKTTADLASAVEKATMCAQPTAEQTAPQEAPANTAASA